MYQSIRENQRSLLCCPSLPLAVYREVSAHLRQVNGVEADLIAQPSQQFNYKDSQIGGLWIEFSATTDSAERERVEQILAYYSDRYAPWEPYNA